MEEMRMSCNHPKSAVFFDFQEVPTFVLKKAMFNLNESNRFVMSRNPVDLRKGVDSLCGAIRSCHLDPLNGDVYVFSNRSPQPYRIETPPLGTRRVYLVL